MVARAPRGDALTPLGTLDPCPTYRPRPARLAGAAPARRPDDHRRRADPVRPARGRRHPRGRGADAVRRGPGRPRPAAHRARPRHALPPRPGVVPRRLARPRRTRRRGSGAARGPGGDRARPAPASRSSPSCRSCGCRRATSRSPRCSAGGARRARSRWSTRARCTRSSGCRSRSCSTRSTGSRCGTPRLAAGPAFLIGDDKDLILWGFTAGIIARLFDFVGWTAAVGRRRDAGPARPHAGRPRPRRQPTR